MYRVFEALDELGVPGTSYAVDTWAGDIHTGSFGDDVYNELKTYHDPLYGKRSRLIRATFDEALANFADGRLIFTDPGTYNPADPDPSYIFALAPDGAASVVVAFPEPVFPNGLAIEADVVPAEARGAVATLSALSADAPWSDVVGPDLTFHRAIIDAAGSERLQRAYHGLQSEIVLCMVQLQPAYDHPQEVAAEHEELLAAIEARDTDRAEKLWRAHLDEAAANQIKALAPAGPTTIEEEND